MNKMKKLSFAVLAVAALSGCATTRTADFAASATSAMPVEQVSKPAPSYGSMGGYRYRRFVAVSASAT